MCAALRAAQLLLGRSQSLSHPAFVRHTQKAPRLPRTLPPCCAVLWARWPAAGSPAAAARERLWPPSLSCAFPSRSRRARLLARAPREAHRSPPWSCPYSWRRTKRCPLTDASPATLPVASQWLTRRAARLRCARTPPCTATCCARGLSCVRHAATVARMQTLDARQRSMLTPTLQEREQSVDAVITAYTARLKERTRHHLGCVLRE